MGRAAALSYARAVNVRAGDLPGAALGAGEREAKPTAAEARVAACTGGVDPSRRLVGLKSVVLRLGAGAPAGEIKSSVEVFPSKQLAAHNFAASRSRRGRTCLATALSDRFGARASSRAKISHLTLSSLPVPTPRHTHPPSFGIRLRADVSTGALSGASMTVTLYIDALVLLAGPAEVELTAFRIGQAPPAEVEQRLFKLLEQRAEARAA